VTPSHYIWVSNEGNDRDSGSKDAPMASIQAAIDASRPGTAVLVEAGTYFENVKITQNGTDSAPIWLVSADGDGAATIVPLSETTSTVYGRGVDNFVISGFEIDGADKQHGIEFTQAGRDYHNWANNIVIENNHITGTGYDGVKLAQTVNVEVRGNTIVGGSEESIDMVTVYDAVISGNEISGLDGRSGITAKGGSERILIEKNSITDVGADGITIGGWTDETLVGELSLSFQARDVVVKDNFIEGVDKRAINILGAQDSVIRDNYIDPQNDYFSTINIQTGRWGLDSKNTVIEDNIITRENWLHVNNGQGNGLDVGQNDQDGSWDYPVGLEAQSSTNFGWIQELVGSDAPSLSLTPTSNPVPISEAAWTILRSSSTIPISLSLTAQSALASTPITLTAFKACCRKMR